MTVIQDLISGGNPKKVKMVNIYYKDLVINPENTIFKQEDIEQLAENIQEIGLLEPLVVTELSNGKYLLISGHRRTAAHKYLVEAKHLEEYEDIACRVLSFEDEQAELVALFSSNAQRQYETKDKILITRKAGELYDQLVKEGKRPAGRKREWIAQLTGFSSRSVQDYLAANQLEEMVKENVATLPQSDKKEKSLLQQAQAVEKTIQKLIKRCDQEEVVSEYITTLEMTIAHLIDDLIDYEREEVDENQLQFDGFN